MQMEISASISSNNWKVGERWETQGENHTLWPWKTGKEIGVGNTATEDNDCGIRQTCNGISLFYLT